jgi:hypothetical protein
VVLSLGLSPELASAETAATKTSNADSNTQAAAETPAQPAAANTSSSAAPAPPAAAKESASAAAPSANAPAPATKGQVAATKSGPAVAAAPSRPARASTSKPATRPARAAAGAGVTTTQTLAPQDERVTYQYNALGRRDPFRPLVGGGFVGTEQSSAPPDVGGMRVVGIVWGSDDKFALVEDPRGTSLVLRQGDKVMNGVVETLRRDAVVVKLNIDGQTQMVAIPLSRK